MAVTYALCGARLLCDTRKTAGSWWRATGWERIGSLSICSNFILSPDRDMSGNVGSMERPSRLAVG